jgi:hypothetical protein
MEFSETQTLIALLSVDWLFSGSSAASQRQCIVFFSTLVESRQHHALRESKFKFLKRGDYAR